MQLPESWLREFCDPPIGTAELADRLTMAGHRGRGGAPVAPPFRGVVVAKVLSVAPHPNADRLSVCAGRRRRGRAARDRLRCAERARRHQGAVRARRRRAAAGEDGASEPFRIERRQDPRRREPRHAVLGARAEALRRPRGACWCSTTTRRSAPTCASSSASTTRSSRSSSRRTSAMPQRLRRRARSRGDHRRAAEVRRRSRTAPVAATQTLPVTIEAPDLCGRFSGRVVTRRRPEREDAALDGRPPGALRPAHGLAAGRHLELRDVRARPAVAHLRPRQDRARPHGALGHGRARRSSCSTATPSSSTRRSA